jgi:predicted  nucleic acid-binding Zn-ribbon protein
MTTEELITKTAQETVDRMQEFHREEMKVMREYFDTRFDSLDRRLSLVETELGQATSALTELLQEFKTHREKVVALEAEIASLRSRLERLEAKVGV